MPVTISHRINGAQFAPTLDFFWERGSVTVQHLVNHWMSWESSQCKVKNSTQIGLYPKIWIYLLLHLGSPAVEQVSETPSTQVMCGRTRWGGKARFALWFPFSHTQHSHWFRGSLSPQKDEHCSRRNATRKKWSVFILQISKHVSKISEILKDRALDLEKQKLLKEKRFLRLERANLWKSQGSRVCALTMCKRRNSWPWPCRLN